MTDQKENAKPDQAETPKPAQADSPVDKAAATDRPPPRQRPKTTSGNNTSANRSRAAGKRKNSQSAKSSKPSSAKKLIPWLVVVVLGAVGYLGWDHIEPYLDRWMGQDETKEVVEDESVDGQTSSGDPITELRASVSALEGQLEELQLALSTQPETSDQKLLALEEKLEQSLGLQKQQVSQQLQQQQSVVEQVQLRVNSQGSRLRDLASSTREDWQLAEAEYLLRLAGQRLLTERNTENPLQLMQTADQILTEFDDPDLFSVRQQIAEEITALKVAGNFDREGVYLRINALTPLIDELELVVKTDGISGAERAVDSEQGSDAVEPSSLSGKAAAMGEKAVENAQGFLHSLKNHIRIRHRDEPIQPLLSIEEERLLRHNLRMMLEQAQMALLREKPTIYRISLEKCRVWLANYFTQNRAALVMQEELTTLSAMTISQNLPDLSRSLESLRNYVNLWHLSREGKN